MQKKLIALAIAGLASGAAFAQTNVTLYGIADAGYVYSSGGSNRLFNANSDDRTFSGIQSGVLSGSRLGFRGSEALGNGLKAIFTLEYGLAIDDNQGIGTGQSSNARQQFVGLQSDKLGTVALGRQYAPGYQATVNNDPMGGSVLGSVAILTTATGNTINPGTAARWNNGMTYTSPNWSGFTAKAIYSFGESQPLDGVPSYSSNLSASDNGRWGVGGNYANGPINVDLVYQSRQSVTPDLAASISPPLGTSNRWGNDINEYYVGGSYDFKVVKVMGSWQQQNDKNTVNNDNTVWTLGASVPVMAASNILFSYGQLINDDAGALGLIDGNTNTATLGWTTAMSKRTTLYAGYVWIDNDKRSRAVRMPGVPADIGALNETNNTFAAGIRHTF
jgi:predicted porin